MCMNRTQADVLCKTAHRPKPASLAQSCVHVFMCSTQAEIKIQAGKSCKLHQELQDVQHKNTKNTKNTKNISSGSKPKRTLAASSS